jgi:hypothetical protein
MAKLTNLNFMDALSSISKKRGAIFGIIIFMALIAFEIFNFSTTEFALKDVLGDLSFAGITWAAILAVAFCGIDFAGIARIFTPEQGRDEPVEVWYLFGAWLLAAVMNASLTWWGVSVAIQNHQPLGSAVLGADVVSKVVPIFVALMVLTIRVLIIGTFSVAGERLFSIADDRSYSHTSSYSRPATNSYPARPMPSMSANPTRPPSTVISNSARPASVPPLVTARSLMTQSAQSAPRPAPKPEPAYQSEPAARPEPSYHPIGSLSASPKDDYMATRR